MTATLSAREQASISSATAMLSQCSLQEPGDAVLKSDFSRRFSSDSTGSTTSRIQRRNAVANLFEGIDLSFIKQLAEADGNR